MKEKRQHVIDLKFFPCKFCGKCAYSIKSLHKHKAKMHSEKSKKFMAHKHDEPNKSEWVCRNEIFHQVQTLAFRMSIQKYFLLMY